MPQNKTIRVATRASFLATTQTKIVIDELKKKHPEYTFQLKQYTTEGDKDRTTSLTSFGNTGLFVKELETALLQGDADIAVHSLKDVPSNTPQGLELSSFPQRENPSDVLLSGTNSSIDELPQNAVIGTGSPRRILQLKILRDDLIFKEIRGNIETRMKKMEQGMYDAIVLAAAGLNRANFKYREGSILDANQFIPAIGQGILALETRMDDVRSNEIVKSINHTETMHAAIAERIFMQTVEGGCKFPLAAHATLSGDFIYLNTIIGDLNSGKYIKESITTPIDEYTSSIKEFALQLKKRASAKNINLK